MWIPFALGMSLCEAPSCWAEDTKVVLVDEAAVAQCAALKSADFFGIADAPTQVNSAKVVQAHGTVHAYCEVRGSVAPTVGFLLLLPVDHWNGKFLEQGCGGFCGRSYNGVAFFDGAQLAQEDLLNRGYALLTFDGGQSGDAGSALWAYQNLPAQFDFGIRAAHVAALAGKAIMGHYFQSRIVKSYFWGCSTGGGQALSEAQRFPWDFDGIIAGAPSPTFSGPMMNYLWAGEALAGAVNRTDLKLVHNRAVAQCDLDDGVKDGVIGDALHCSFDPTRLRCQSSKKPGCLTAAQVEAVKKVYSGPLTSKGEKIGTGGPLPGSELNWISETDEAGASYVNASGLIAPWAGEYFSLVGFMPAPGPGWNPSKFDFDRDYQRLRLAESLFGAADNPDLRKFKSAGGKLLLYQGAQDQSDIPTDAIDYYETAQKTLGGRAATQEFFRLFVVPGMDHCGGGEGAFDIDYLKYLESWVEEDRAPEKLIGAHIDLERFMSTHDTKSEQFMDEFQKFRSDPKSKQFTRPVFPYPVRARYQGKGDANDAANFGPVEP